MKTLDLTKQIRRCHMWIGLSQSKIRICIHWPRLYREVYTANRGHPYHSAVNNPLWLLPHIPMNNFSNEIALQSWSCDFSWYCFVVVNVVKFYLIVDLWKPQGASRIWGRRVFLAKQGDVFLGAKLATVIRAIRCKYFRHISTLSIKVIYQTACAWNWQYQTFCNNVTH